MTRYICDKIEKGNIDGAHVVSVRNSRTNSGTGVNTYMDSQDLFKKVNELLSGYPVRIGKANFTEDTFERGVYVDFAHVRSNERVATLWQFFQKGPQNPDRSRISFYVLNDFPDMRGILSPLHRILAYGWLGFASPPQRIAYSFESLFDVSGKG